LLFGVVTHVSFIDPGLYCVALLLFQYMN